MAYTKTNWVNDSVPAINAGNLNKIEQGIYEAHQKTDTIGDLSDLDTIDKSSIVNAINEVKGSEVVLYNTKIVSGNTVNINMTGYKRLLITCCVYDYLDDNTGGGSNIVILDLEKKGDNMTGYVTTNCFAYLSDDFAQAQNNMQVAIVVNAQKSQFTPYFYYNGALQTSNAYYVSKIVGVK